MKDESQETPVRNIGKEFLSRIYIFGISDKFPTCLSLIQSNSNICRPKTPNYCPLVERIFACSILQAINLFPKIFFYSKKSDFVGDKKLLSRRVFYGVCATF
jgi:hypothetical protein